MFFICLDKLLTLDLAEFSGDFSVRKLGTTMNVSEIKALVYHTPQWVSFTPPYPRSTQPCIPPGSLNRVPASAGVKAGKSPLPGGR